MRPFVFRAAIVLTVVGATYWVKSIMDPNRQPVSPLIPELVNEAFDQRSGVCIEAGPFPYDTSSPPTQWRAHVGNYATCEPIRCDRCEDLVEAGLLSKEQGDGFDAEGVARTTVTYELTEEGRELYQANIEDESAWGVDQQVCSPGDTMTGATPEDNRQPGLCFAEGRKLYKVTERLKPMQLGGDKVQGFRFVMQAVDPKPFIFDPRARRLLKSVPERSTEPGAPALYPPMITTLVMFPDGKSGRLDGGLRYGKWVNEK